MNKFDIVPRKWITVLIPKILKCRVIITTFQKSSKSWGKKTHYVINL